MPYIFQIQISGFAAMPKRPGSLEAIRLSHELLHRIPKGRKIAALELINNWWM